MKNKFKVAVLGSTGYVGKELVKILSNHPSVDINFLGSESEHGTFLTNINNTKEYSNLPNVGRVVPRGHQRPAQRGRGAEPLPC